MTARRTEYVAADSVATRRVALPARSDARSWTDLVWYAAYGSNMSLTRLRTYLRGGRPEGGALALPGCRHRADPIRSAPLLLPGLMYFATESLTWTGGRAFYDPAGRSEIAVHAHLVTAAQFSDIVAQEMYRAPGADLDLIKVIESGTMTLGPGRYETLVRAGTHESHPVLTFTAPWRYRDLPGNPPAPAYLRHLATGLSAAHHWSTATTAAYLATRPGADLRWTPDSVDALLRAGDL
ncbi:histone deacetylase [Nocardia sp. NBC_01730]|uniref:histone deacetylase n=1 Tax=Nocardia sp. NBC_01730 TaxID=2975998 RepID=UPI002E166F79|nr:histone deacetylase [Nocardia sp. NBC_01730]